MEILGGSGHGYPEGATQWQVDLIQVHEDMSPLSLLKMTQNEKWNAFTNVKQVFLPLISPLKVSKLFWWHTRISQWATVAAEMLHLDQSFMFQQASQQWISSYHIAIDKNAFFVQFVLSVCKVHIWETELLPCFYMLGFNPVRPTVAILQHYI